MATRKFAEGTSVAVEKSRAEIEGLLKRYGCTDFAYRSREGLAMIAFEMQDRLVRFSLPMPLRDDRKFLYRKVRGYDKRCNPDQQFELWDAECRRLWRCLALSIKAKLEAVQSGISQFESEFLANVVDKVSGKTMDEIIRPWIETRYKGLPAPDGSAVANLELDAAE